MTDKIREDFEKWRNSEFEENGGLPRDSDVFSFEAGYQAALSSLEHVGTAAVACNTLSVGWTEVLAHNEKLYRIRRV